MSSSQEKTSSDNPNFGEARGTRRHARAQATIERRLANERKSRELSVAPSTSAEAAGRWDAFYRTKPNLFKDRHLLRETFPELMPEEVAADPKRHVPPLQALETADSSVTGHNAVDSETVDTISTRICEARENGCDLFLLEAGCGGGNAVFPVLRANPRLFAFAFDYSKEAVAVTRASPEYRRDRICAFQADLTDPSVYVELIRAGCPKGVDFVTAFWTLSALPPSAHKAAIDGLVSMLSEGGMLFVRDYGTGDMRQERFLTRGRQVDEENTGRLFLRGDGTYAYFFETEEIRSLFEGAGLVCESCDYEERVVENRKRKLVMRRRWVQAKFRKPSQPT